jgi:tetratricopeptide (TPR) repeat protein
MPDVPTEPDVRGIERAGSGNPAAGAETAFREADEAGSTAVSFARTRLLADQTEGRGAIAAFQRAIRRGHEAPRFLLGDLLAQSADPRGLITAYRVAAERGDQGAAYQLGLLYLDRGDLESAKSAFSRADKLGHAWATLALGEILEQAGDRTGAIAAYRRAADRRVSDAQTLLEALAGSGDTVESIAPSRPTGKAALPRSTKRSTHRRLAWSAGTVAALAALLVVALLTLLPSGHTAPNERVGTAPATRAGAGGIGSGAPQSGGLPPFGSPITSFTAKQATLLDSVPSAAHAECLPGAEKPLPRSGASIRCFASAAGITVLYYRYSSLPLLRSVFHNYRAWFAARHRLRDCAGRTHGKYFQGSAGSAVAGRWACFYNDRTIPQSACIDWADFGLLTFGSACQADGDFTALARWWTHAGPVPASTDGRTNRY